METPPLVFDTGPLSHFAKAGWLGALKAVVGDCRAVIPDAVVAELQAGARTDPRLHTILDADWIEHHLLTTDAEARAFTRFSSALASGRRNRGEAAVLAVAETCPAVAVIDDAAGRKVAKAHGPGSFRPRLRGRWPRPFGYDLTVKTQRPSVWERWPQLGPAKWVPKMRMPESA